MKLVIREYDRKPEEALRRALERELPEQLSRLAPRLRSVAVSIRDLNGPRGGVDQEIRVIAEFVTGGKIVVRHRTANVLFDTPATIRRVVRAARNELGRRRRIRRVGYRRHKEAVAA
jgi:putative sigma-54 modulation protein